MVRTVAGLRPVRVLWRRLDAAFADPLELDATSRLGTPGLVGALRQGSVTLVNALGSGILETRALLAFLPRIAEALLGEPLILPNIATWWCGQPAERAHVRAHKDRMMIGPALSTRLPFETDDTTVLGGRFRAKARALLRRLARGRRRRARRPGGGDALDHAGLRRRRAGAAADEPARLPRPHAARLGGHAGRLRPHRQRARRRAPSPCSAAAPPPTSGWSARARSRPSRMLPTDGHALRPRPPRRAAEPRRRQPLLARPLRRARRGRACA